MTGSALWFIDQRFSLQGLERFPLSADDLRVPKNATLLLIGWAARPSMEPAFDLKCYVDGNAAGSVYSDFREDLGKHFSKPNMSNAGFHAAIDMTSLSLGSHELSISLDDGAYTLPAIAFTVTEPTRLAQTVEQSQRYQAQISAFHSDISAEEKTFRVERPGAAIVRGTLADAQNRGRPDALFGIVDEFEVYPARFDATDSSFLLCLITRTLTLGDHMLRLAVKPRGEAVLELLAPMRFSVTPLSVSIAGRGPAASTAVASCSWASDVPTTQPASAARRILRRGELAHVRGWVFDRASADAVSEIHICFENGEQFKMEARQLREDVAQAHSVPEARYCGFVGTIAANALESGPNVGRAYVVTKDEVSLMSTDATVEIEVIG